MTTALVLADGRDNVGLPLLLAAVPVVLFGLAEDLTRNVRPRYRMAAAVVSAMVASAYSGGVVPKLDLPAITALIRSQMYLESSVQQQPEPQIEVTPILNGVYVRVVYVEAQTGRTETLAFEVTP